jgi:hypothetical protein
MKLNESGNVETGFLYPTQSEWFQQALRQISAMSEQTAYH